MQSLLSITSILSVSVSFTQLFSALPVWWVGNVLRASAC